MVMVAAFPWVWRQWVETRYDALILTPEQAPQARVAVVFGARV